METKLKIGIKTDGLGVVAKKLERLAAIVEEAKSLVDDLASDGIGLDLEVRD